jgi:hypothetical protein
MTLQFSPCGFCAMQYKKRDGDSRFIAQRPTPAARTQNTHGQAPARPRFAHSTVERQALPQQRSVLNLVGYAGACPYGIAHNDVKKQQAGPVTTRSCCLDRTRRSPQVERLDPNQFAGTGAAVVAPQ